MTPEPTFRILTLLLFVAVVGTSVYFRHKAERQGGAMVSAEGKRPVAVLRLVALLVLAPFFGYLINPGWVSWARIPVPDGVRWLAALVGFAMVPAVIWLFRALGTNISPTESTRTDHRLITTGPYRWIRHPLYTFGFIFFIALAVLTGLWTLGVGMVIPIAFLMWRVPREEARLVERFGDEYRQYMQRTGRYFPRLNR